MKHNGYIHSAGTEDAREAIAKKYGSASAPLTKDVRRSLIVFQSLSITCVMPY